MKNRLMVIFFLLVFVYSCVPIKEVEQNTPAYRYNFSSLYNPGESILQPEIRMYSSSDSEAIVFYRLRIDEVWAAQDNALDSIMDITMKFALRDLKTFEIVDSSRQVIKIGTDTENEYFSSYFKINTKPDSQYKLIVGFYGTRSNSGKRLIIELDNSTGISKDDFLIKNSVDESISYDNYVGINRKYIISSNSCSNELVRVDYYDFGDYQIIPPYYLTNLDPDVFQADSTFMYRLGDSIVFTKKGFYKMKASSNDIEGLCLLCSYDTYPEVGTVADMLEPLKIITGNKQYKKLTEAENLKVSIDEFWLERSNNTKFAKEQIRVYYNRVRLANMFFSDYRQGWKSDRGILYVLMGPPSIVNMNSKGEEWFYGENQDLAGVYFMFDKVKSPYSDYVFELRRDAAYQTVWSQAVSTWRDGRIFTITKN